MIRARELLDLHRRTRSAYWRWGDGMLARTLFEGKASTVFGWTIYVDRQPNARSLQNFPIQAHGADMMRLAACLATEQGIEVVAPVHDAFLIVAPLDRLDEHVQRMQACMAEASRVVLDGFEIKSDTKIIRYPDRYMDEDRGAELWSAVQEALVELEGCNEAALHHRNGDGEGSLSPLS